MKRIKNRKLIYTHVFVTALLLTLLTSLLVGIVVAPKPDKPGKPGEPSPDLVEADFKIWIGNGELNSPEEEDIVLQPYDGKDYLLVENEVGGYWLPPPTKGKATREGWGVGLGPEGEGDYCGKYIINDSELANIMTSKGFNSDLEAYRFNIFHSTETNPRKGEGDYWHILIQWEVGTWVYPNPPPDVIPRFLMLVGETDMGPDPEGVYDEIADTWTVTFDNAEFELYENTTEPDDPDTGSVLNKLWDGQLSFTVKITREPHVA